MHKITSIRYYRNKSGKIFLIKNKKEVKKSVSANDAMKWELIEK